MSALNSLPADQRAVLELVLARGRNYDEIARLLSIDRAGVRERALAALDGLGPANAVEPVRRALLTDYLLGQLPPRVAEDVAARVGREPNEAEWARTVSEALAPIATHPLPPVGASEDREPADATAEAVVDTLAGGRPASAPASATAVSGAAEPDADTDAAGPARPSSRRGGAVVLGLGVLAVAAIVVILIAALGGGGSSSGRSATVASRTSTTSGTPSTAVRGAIPLRLTPAAKGSKAQGIAEAFKQSGAQYLAIVAINLTANATSGTSRNFYAVWLSDGAGGNRLLGFAPTVTSNGQLRAATKLASTDTRYTRLLVTLETQAHPSAPGSTILSGPFRLS